MIFDLYTMNIATHRFDDVLEAEAQAAFEHMSRYLSVVGAFFSRSGALNTLIYLAAFDSFAEREAARVALSQDDGWRSFRRDAGQAVIGETLTVLNPTTFSPLSDAGELAKTLVACRTRGRPMLFEMRTYTAIPGHIPTVLKMLVEEGNPLTHQYVQWPVAYFMAESGLANRVMMLWAYDDAGERARRKSMMLPDPRFQELGSRFNLHFSEQRSDIWSPLPFSPLR